MVIIFVTVYIGHIRASVVVVVVFVFDVGNVALLVVAATFEFMWVR